MYARTWGLPRRDFQIEDQGVSTMPGARRRCIRSPLYAWLAALTLLAVLTAVSIGFPTNSGQWSEASGWGAQLESPALAGSDSTDHGHSLSKDNTAAANVTAWVLPDSLAPPGHCPHSDGQEAKCSTGIAPAVLTESLSDRPDFSPTFMVAGPPPATADTSKTHAYPVSLLQLSTSRV